MTSPTTGLAVSFLRAGPGRAALVTGCTALVSGLLLVVLAVVRHAAAPTGEVLSDLVTDPGLVGGYLLAVLLTSLAPLTLLRQVLRLGTAAREQRLAALRLVGATPGEVRRLAALEVGGPALVGGVLGYPVLLLLRAALGGLPADTAGAGRSEVERQLALVPSVPLPWWQVLLVVVLVGAAGAGSGAATSRALTVSPLGVARHGTRPAPRPWGLALLALAGAAPVVALAAGSTLDTLHHAWGAVLLPLVVVLLVAGLLALAPWVAHHTGRRVADRARSVPALVAGRRLATDSRAAGRAAAAVGVISLVAGAGGALLADLPGSTYRGSGFADVEAFYLVPVVLGGGVLLAALVLVVFSMAVHGVESAHDRRRALASLGALGVPLRELERVQRWEVGVVALPMAVLGVLLGSLLYGGLAGTSAYPWIPVIVDAGTVGLVWLAVLASTRLTRPWLRRAASPALLRTP